MTPDVQAAAERCRDFAGPGWVDVENVSPECVADLLTLARAYLALTPTPPEVIAAAGRLAPDVRPDDCGGLKGFVADAYLVARWVLEVRRAAGGPV